MWGNAQPQAPRPLMEYLSPGAFAVVVACLFGLGALALLGVAAWWPLGRRAPRR